MSEADGQGHPDVAARTMLALLNWISGGDCPQQIGARRTVIQGAGLRAPSDVG